MEMPKRCSARMNCVAINLAKGRVCRFHCGGNFVLGAVDAPLLMLVGG